MDTSRKFQGAMKTYMAPPGHCSDAFGNEIHIHLGVWDPAHGR